MVRVWDERAMTRAAKNMIRGNGSVAAGFARALVQLAVRMGANRKRLCATAGLDPKLLDEQDNRVPLSTYRALMRAAKEETGDPAFALHFGEAFDMSELSIVGLIGGACETVGEAFAAMSRYERLIADIDGREHRLVLTLEGHDLWLIDTRDNPNDFPELTESSFARIASARHRWPDGAPLLRGVEVTHKTPTYRAEYDRIFEAPVRFEAGRNALLLAGGDWLAARTPLPSRYLFGVLSERAEALLQDLHTSTSVRGHVESVLMPILHTGEANMVVVAERLAMSRQTLFRKLKAEGVTFEKVLDALRQRLATAYLADKKVSVNETAYLLGFSDPAAFSRAFKRWTGTSPRGMRNGGA